MWSLFGAGTRRSECVRNRMLEKRAFSSFVPVARTDHLARIPAIPADARSYTRPFSFALSFHAHSLVISRRTLSVDFSSQNTHTSQAACRSCRFSIRFKCAQSVEQNACECSVPFPYFKFQHRRILSLLIYSCKNSFFSRLFRIHFVENKSRRDERSRFAAGFSAWHSWSD
jgi:hypothetical protein